MILYVILGLINQGFNSSFCERHLIAYDPYDQQTVETQATLKHIRELYKQHELEKERKNEYESEQE